MSTFKELHEARRSALQRRLRDCADASATSSALDEYFEALRQAYFEENSLADAASVNARMDAARAAVALVAAMTKATISVSPALPTARAGRFDCLKRALVYLPAALCLVLTVALSLDGKGAAAALAAVAAAAGIVPLLKTGSATPAPERVEATPIADTQALLQRADMLALALDREEEQKRGRDESAPELGDSAWEAIQALFEAKLTGDGEYALSAVSALKPALEKQGVSVVEYSPEAREWFDLYPSLDGEVTIRPALVKDGNVIARGQATTRA